jgi:ribosome-associated protein
MAKTTKKKAVKKSVKSVTDKKAIKKPTTKKTSAKKSENKKASAKKVLVKKSPSVKKAIKTTETKKEPVNENLLLAQKVVEGMQEKKAKNIQLLDLRKIQNRVTDFFVICDAESNTHVDAIADSVFDVVRKTLNVKPYRSEGFENKEWILLDYITVVAHVFRKDIRDFYNLESLWADADIKNYD